MAKEAKNLPIGITPQRSFRGSWLDIVNLCLKHGFCGVEFKYEPPFNIPQLFDQDMLSEVTKLGVRKDLVYSIHAPYSNIGELLLSRWSCAVKEQLEAVKVANFIGAKTITSHSGFMPIKYYSKNMFPKVRANALKALRKAVKRTNEIDFCLENQNKVEPGKMKCALSPSDLKSLADDIQEEVFFTFDLGHANTFGLGPEKFANKLGPKRIKVAHLHDNDGTEDSHKAVGEGNIDFSKFLSEYMKNEWHFPLFLEMSNEEAFVRSKKRLEKMWASLCSTISV